jgi:phage gpG-like protein
MAGDAEITNRGGFKFLEQAVQNPVRALTQIGRMITSRSKKAFPEQRRFGEAWAPRMNPNIPGIISDLGRGVTVKARRFQERPAVMDTGRLMASIDWVIVEPTVVQIGTNLQYASDQQFGGSREIFISGTVRRNARSWLLRSSLPAHIVSALWWITKSHVFRFAILARPFIGVDDQDMADIQEVVRINIFHAGNFKVAV